MEQTRSARYRSLVEAEIAELEALRRQSAEDRAPVALDQQSVGRLARMDAMQVQAMALAAERRRAARLDRLHRVLQRIEDGEFGWCDSCGEEIPDGRLDVDPSAQLCVACARAQER